MPSEPVCRRSLWLARTFGGAGRSYDISRDGRRFLMMKAQIDPDDPLAGLTQNRRGAARGGRTQAARTNTLMSDRATTSPLTRDRQGFDAIQNEQGEDEA